MEERRKSRAGRYTEALEVQLTQAFGCWKPQKASRGHARRPGAVFARFEAYQTAPGRLVCPESRKDGAVP